MINSKSKQEDSLQEAVEKFSEAISEEMQPVIIAFSNFTNKFLSKFFGL